MIFVLASTVFPFFNIPFVAPFAIAYAINADMTKIQEHLTTELATEQPAKQELPAGVSFKVEQ